MLFSCSAYVIRLFDRCSRFFDLALDASPLKYSEFLLSCMITARLELLSVTEIYYSWIGCYCSAVYD